MTPAVLSPPVPARAENGCILDDCADKRPPRPARDEGRDDDRRGDGPRGRSRPGEFDFYVLSLSWSPGFCLTGGDEKGRDQCRRGADLGFTVHGLWPQYERGFPSDCRGQTNPPREALALTAGVYPDPGLARYEWRRHGTCSGLAPLEYFRAAKAARDAVTIPERLRDPHAAQSLSPTEVEHAFLDANAKLRPGAIAATCRRGILEEVRVCFSKDLRDFQLCPAVMRERCRSDTMDVPAVR